MNNQILNISGVECYEQNGVAYLKLDTVARGLGFTEIATSGNECVKWTRVRKYLADFGVDTSVDGGRLPEYIPENIFYRLAMKAKNETAERFQAKIADEVIPSIRKHGAYITPEKIEEILLNPDTIIRMATDLKKERELRIAAEETIKENRPMVEFANHVSNTKDLITMAEMAKIARDENIDIGRNRLINWLKKNKYLRSNGEPYQKYINQGLFDVKESVKYTPYGTKVFPITLVTGKGQIYIVEKLREEVIKGCDVND